MIAWITKLRDRLRDNPHKVRWIVSRVLHRSGLCVLLTMQRDGISFRFYRSSLSLELWSDPDYGRADREVIRAAVTPGDVVVDVGANIGMVALEAARAVGPRGKVIAYEPHPRTARFLLGNIGLNRVTNIEVRQVALGAAPGAGHLSDLSADDMNVVDPSAGIDIRLSTLDQDLAGVAGPIALLKVDVEGYELPVLLGGAATLARSARVYVEIAEDHFTRFGYHAEDLLGLLDEAGLDLYGPCAKGWVRIGTKHIEPGHGVVNILGVRRTTGERQPVGAHLALADLAPMTISESPPTR